MTDREKARKVAAEIVATWHTETEWQLQPLTDAIATALEARAREVVTGAKIIYRASEDGEWVQSCCEGKHLPKTTLMAGDILVRVSYVDAPQFERALKEQS